MIEGERPGAAAATSLRAAGDRASSQSLIQRLGLSATVLVFAIALVSRLLWPGLPINIDEDLWMRRGPAFVGALLHGDLAGTYLRQHPGVTNMWLIGAADSARYLARHLLPAEDLARQSDSLLAYLSAVERAGPMPLELYAWVRSLVALVTAAAFAGIYALGRRLFGRPVALLAVTILLLEPFFLAYQRSLTTDANQSNFTWLALLAFLLYLQGRAAGRSGRSWLVLSGAFFGLALLSKVAALLSLPAVGLWALYLTWRLAHGARPEARRDAWLRTGVDLLLWGALASAVTCVLWPALWTDPARVLARLLQDMRSELSGHPQFFLGQLTAAPGPAYYPLALLLRLSPALLLGTFLGLAALASRTLRRHLPCPLGLLAILLDVVVVLACLTLNGAKMDRYLMPVFPGLAFLAGAGIWALLVEVNQERAARQSATAAPSATASPAPARTWLWPALAVVAIAQLAVLVPHFPYNLTYFNPLAGGPAVAARTLMIGNGELLDRAAAWLSAQPGAAAAGEAGSPSLRIATAYPGAFAPYYSAAHADVREITSDPAAPWPGVNYVVLYVNQFQRGLPPADYFAGQRPLYTVSAHGVNYAQVYPGPAVRPAELAALPQRTDFDFGGRARLAGYQVETPQVAAGDTAAIALYWQAEEQFPSDDYVVYLGLVDGAGVRFGATDSLPVGGHLTVDRWQPGDVIRDVQHVPVPPGTPPGTYRLNLGFYSPSSKKSLAISDAGRRYGSEAPLATLEVTQPERPAAELSGAALAIATPLAQPVALASPGPQLLGYEWTPPAAPRPGDAGRLALLWQAGAGAPAPTELVLQLSAGEQRWQRAQGHLLGGTYPAERWTAGELVRDIWEPLLPADVPPGRYGLALLARTAQSIVPLLDLGQVQLGARPHDYRAPVPEYPGGAELGGAARLLGYDLPEAAAPGSLARITFYWQPLATPERNLARFVHLLDGEGRIMAQADGAPGGDVSTGGTPATAWLPGETLTERVELPLPADLPPGSYRWLVGLYDPVTGERLSTQSGQDAIPLEGSLEVR